MACGGRGQPWREPRLLVHHARRLFNGLAFARRLASSDEREQTGGHAAEGGGSDAASRRGVLPCRGTAGQKRPLPAERRSGPALRILHIFLTDRCTHDQRFRCWTREAARKNRSQMSSRVRNSAMFGERVDFSELPKWPCVRRTSVFREWWRTIATRGRLPFFAGGQGAPEDVLEPHILKTLARMRQVSGPVLVAHDTTDLTFGGLHGREGLGLTNGKQQGFFLHLAWRSYPEKNAWHSARAVWNAFVGPSTRAQLASTHATFPTIQTWNRSVGFGSWSRSKVVAARLNASISSIARATSSLCSRC